MQDLLRLQIVGSRMLPAMLDAASSHAGAKTWDFECFGLFDCVARRLLEGLLCGYCEGCHKSVSPKV